MKKAYLIIVLILVAACDDNSQKLTESQLRFNKAKAEQKVLIDKAVAVLDQKLSGDLLIDLSHLIYAKEVMFRAEQVFIDAKIIGITAPELVILKKRLSAFNKPVAEKSLTLLSISLDKTLAFRRKVLDMPLVPLGESASKSTSMISYMGDDYNKSLTTCCFDYLDNLEIFLRGTDSAQYTNIRRLILNVENDLTKILEDENLISVYQQKLQKNSI